MQTALILALELGTAVWLTDVPAGQMGTSVSPIRSLYENLRSFCSSPVELLLRFYTQTFQVNVSKPLRLDQQL